MKGHNVILTDINKFMQFITDNVELNKSKFENSINICKLNWEEQEDINFIKNIYRFEF